MVVTELKIDGVAVDEETLDSSVLEGKIFALVVLEGLFESLNENPLPEKIVPDDVVVTGVPPKIDVVVAAVLVLTSGFDAERFPNENVLSEVLPEPNEKAVLTLSETFELGAAPKRGFAVVSFFPGSEKVKEVVSFDVKGCDLGS